MQNSLCPTIFEAFEKVVKQYHTQPAIAYHVDGTCLWLSYHDVYDAASSLSTYLFQNHIDKGDRVAIILENSRWWPIGFLSLASLGAVAVPLYPHLEYSELRKLLLHSGSKLIITSENLKTKIAQAAQGLPIQISVINTLDLTTRQRPKIKTIFAADLACILYTSGTTACPKGVMLSHENLFANVESCQKLKIISPRDNVACLLPLYHAYPLMVNFLFPLLTGAKISIAENLDMNEVSVCMKQARVTILVGVPRLFSFIAGKIQAKIDSLNPFSKAFLAGCLGLSFVIRKTTGINPAKLFMRKAHQVLGPSLRFMVSGGARLDPVVARQYYRWGFKILEGYGLTESSPVLAYNTPGANRPGSVGRPVPGVEIKINEPDRQGVGEIIARGRNITRGYYQDAQTTNERLKNNWLYTQDIGYLAGDGFLYITGRKSELIVLSSGKKINPEELEAHYCHSPFIKEVCVFLPAQGQTNNALIALVLPDHEYFRAQQVVQIKDKIRHEIEKVSLALPPYQRVFQYIIINEALPRTVLGKIKRFEINQRYASYTDSIETKVHKAELANEDMLLLETELSGNVTDYLSQRVNRQVCLDDHLELDLGLDSLERISLFFEFQKIAGVEVDEKLFFTVATVRDVLVALRTALADETKHYLTLNWSTVLNGHLELDIKQAAKFKLNVFEKIIDALVMLIISLIGRLVFRLEVKGKEHLPARGPYLICPNHVSFLDPPFVACALPIPILSNTYFMGMRVILESALLGWAKMMLHLVPVDAAQNLIKTLKVCSHILRSSKILCMFPEGGRSTDGTLREFKRGVGILIKELNVPVVPVYIEGAYRAWPLLDRLPHPEKITIHFGAALSPHELEQGGKVGVDTYQAIADNLRQAVSRLAASTRKVSYGPRH